MALAMAAAGIHAEATVSPAEVLARLEQSLSEELRRTEMFLTLFYAVIDPVGGRLAYANAGHAHAFVVTGDAGEAIRLGATRAPLGVAAAAGGGEARPPRRGPDPLRPGTRGRGHRSRGGEGEPDARPRPPRGPGDRHREGSPAGCRTRNAERGTRNRAIARGAGGRAAPGLALTARSRPFCSAFRVPRSAF